jgi:large subunit ribosomal protein L21
MNTESSADSTQEAKAAQAPATKSTPAGKKAGLDSAKTFAVVATDGKQFLVQEGIKVKLDRLDAEKGSSITLSSVLLVGGEGSELKVGTPAVSGASVSCKILRHAREKKIIVFKKKRRHGYTKKQGHRQDYTEVLVESIKF